MSRERFPGRGGECVSWERMMFKSSGGKNHALLMRENKISGK